MRFLFTEPNSQSNIYFYVKMQTFLKLFMDYRLRNISFISDPFIVWLDIRKNEQA